MNSTLVGRTSEQAEIEALVQRARGGRSQPLLISGEPGSGKTAMLQHVLDLAGRAGFRSLRIDADRIDGAVPFAALRLAVDEVPPPSDDAASAAALARLSEVLRFVTLAEDRSPEIVAATLELLTTWAFRHPVIVAVDDLHAADTATVGLIVSLLRATRKQRVFIAVTSTPGGEAGGGPAAECRHLADQDRLAVLELSGLTNAELAELAVQSLGGALDAAFVDALREVTGGLPLLAMDVFSALGNTSERAGHEVASPTAVLSSLPRPTTRLQSAVRYWLSGLGADARRVAAALAVLGEVPGDQQTDLGVLTNLASDRIDAGLAQLVQAGIVCADQACYRFRHRVVRDAVYDDIGPAARRRWHAVAAQLRLDGTANDPAATVALARHLRASADCPDPVAAGILIQAGDLSSHDDPRAAADWYWAALARLGPEDAATEDARCRLSTVLHLSGDYAGAAEHATRVLGTARSSERRARASILAANPQWALGDLARAAELLDAALADPETRSADLFLHRAQLSVWNGRIADAEAFRATAWAFGIDGHEWLADLVDMQLHLAAGRCRDGWRHALRACARSAQRSAGASATARLSAAVAASVDLDPRVAIDLAADVPLDGPMGPWFHAVAAYAMLRQGRLAPALEGARSAHAAVGGRNVMLFSSQVTLIEAGAELGDFRTAEAARAEADTARFQPGRSLIDAAISHLLVVRGDPDAAHKLLSAAEERERSIGRVDTLGIVLAHLVDAALAGSDDQDARAANARLQALPNDRSSVRMTMSQLLARALVDGDEDAAVRAREHAARFGLAIDGARALGALGAARGDVSLVVEAYEELGRLGAAYRQRVLGNELRKRGRRVPSRRGARDEITAAERGVATLVAQGLTNRQVAEQTNLSPKTVEVYLSRIYAKTDCHSRVELAIAVNEGRFGWQDHSFAGQASQTDGSGADALDRR